MKSKKLLQSLFVAFLFNGVHSCAGDPRQTIERKYERKVEEARKNERIAIAENNGSHGARLRRAMAGIELALAEQELACTKVRTLREKAKALSQPSPPWPAGMEVGCVGKGE